LLFIGSEAGKRFGRTAVFTSEFIGLNGRTEVGRAVHASISPPPGRNDAGGAAPWGWRRA
jgi:hypothetical protein